MEHLDAERAATMWRRLIADDDLVDAVLAGDLASAAAARGLGADDVAVLAKLAATPDALRWNITNLRFRGSLDTMLKVRRWLPLTTALLSEGRSDWLIDLCYEYLDHHRWEELGHRHFAECLRFVAFIETRVAERRRLPEHIATTIAYEAAICRLLAATEPGVDGPAAASPAEVGDAGCLPDAVPRPVPVSDLLCLDADISPWIVAGRPTGDPPVARPTWILAFVPAEGDTFFAVALDDDQLAVYRRCDGVSTAREIADGVASERGVRPADVLALLDAWVREGALCAPSRPQGSSGAQVPSGDAERRV